MWYGSRGLISLKKTLCDLDMISNSYSLFLCQEFKEVN
jgi:hypothetical protein